MYTFSSTSKHWVSATYQSLCRCKEYEAKRDVASESNGVDGGNFSKGWLCAGHAALWSAKPYMIWPKAPPWLHFLVLSMGFSSSATLVLESLTTSRTVHPQGLSTSRSFRLVYSFPRPLQDPILTFFRPLLKRHHARESCPHHCI